MRRRVSRPSPAHSARRTGPRPRAEPPIRQEPSPQAPRGRSRTPSKVSARPQRRDAASHGAPPGGRSAHVTATDRCSRWPSARRSTAISLRLDLGKMPLSLAAPAAPVPVSRHAPSPQRVDDRAGTGGAARSLQAGARDPGPSSPPELQSHPALAPSRGRVACAGKECTELRLLTLTIPRGLKGQVSATEVTLSPRSKGTTSGSQSPRGKGTKS